MPRYTPSDEEMETYGSTPVTPPEESSAPEKASSVDEENMMGAEILIDKDKLPPGCKVGDTYTFRVTKDYGDEASLELVDESEGEEEDMETEEPMSETSRELTALSGESE